jgi:hypothetical protein
MALRLSGSEASCALMRFHGRIRLLGLRPRRQHGSGGPSYSHRAPPARQANAPTRAFQRPNAGSGKHRHSQTEILSDKWKWRQWKKVIRAKGTRYRKRPMKGGKKVTPYRMSSTTSNTWSIWDGSWRQDFRLMQSSDGLVFVRLIRCKRWHFVRRWNFGYNR